MGNNLTAAERERFLSKTTRDGVVGDCLGWTGPLDLDGYGTFYLRRKGRRAHRVAWYDSHGEIPAGMVVNHVCGNRACVNVQHLSLLTRRENALKDSRSRAYVNSQKTHCPRGHEYDMVVAYRGRGPERMCSTCDRERKRRIRQKWRAEDTLNV